jgi:hypothetical protein
MRVRALNDFTMSTRVKPRDHLWQDLRLVPQCRRTGDGNWKNLWSTDPIVRILAYRSQLAASRSSRRTTSVAEFHRAVGVARTIERIIRCSHWPKVPAFHCTVRSPGSVLPIPIRCAKFHAWRCQPRITRSPVTTPHPPQDGRGFRFSCPSGPNARRSAHNGYNITPGRCNFALISAR